MTKGVDDLDGGDTYFRSENLGGGIEFEYKI